MASIAPLRDAQFMPTTGKGEQDMFSAFIVVVS